MLVRDSNLQRLSATPLLEREEELGAVARRLRAARDGQGALVVVEGPSGIGKTTLLRAAAELAERDGFAVFRAAGVELERSFPWGVARQLFERPLAALDGAARERALAGVAGLASEMVLSTPDTPASGADGSFAALHALYWLTANLAEIRPALLVVDDGQWADEPALRFLAYVAARIGDMPVVLLVGTRPPEVGSAVLRALARDPNARRLAPAPLSAGAVAALLETMFGEPPADAFTAACHESSGGNPFLLATLAESLADLGTGPSTAAASQARELGSTSLAETVVHRMLRLPGEAQRLAQALAVLAPEGDLRVVAELAGLDPQAATAAADALVAAHIVGPARPLALLHPLLQSAIAAATPPAERARLHAMAATMLAANGAAPERVAGHWLLAAPGAEQGAADALREAAHVAAARGAPDAALRYLRRALEEPQSPHERGELLAQLGTIEVRLGLQVGERHLRQALAATTDGRRYGQLVRELRLLLFATGRHAEAAELFTGALARLGDADRELRLRLRAGEAIAIRHAFGRGADLGDAADLPGTTPAERSLLAVAAFERTIAHGTVEEVAALCDRASGGHSIAEESYEHLPFALLVDALLATDRHQEAAALNQVAVERTRRGSLRVASATLSWTAAMIARAQGALPDAIAHAERALAEARALHVDALRVWAAAVLVSALVDRGRLDDARSALGEQLSTGGRFAEDWLRFARARLRLADGDAAGARSDLEELLAEGSGWGADNPAFYPLRSTLARALLAAGERDAAEAAAAEELELAGRWGARTAIGNAQLTLGLCRTGDAALDLLTAAAATLDGSPAQLVRARSLVELGAAIRRAGRRTESLEPLRAGLALADRCGADPLAERAREELRAAGVRPRRSALGGVEALTPSELRVARLAADGLTNRAIAQALFVTRSTVEVHLTHVYQKLSISNRGELESALTER